MTNVVVVGDVYAAVAAQTERPPRPYQTVHGTGLRVWGTGRGLLQAVAAARLGANVTFIGRVGTDAHAQIALQPLTEAGIPTHSLVRDKSAPTGTQITLRDADGKPMTVQVPAANHRLTASDVERAKQALDDADVLVTQLGVPQDAVRAALSLARERGVQSVFKPAPFASVPPGLLALADVVTPNEEELRALALNAAPTTTHTQITVCTLGARGAQWFRHSADGTRDTGRVAGFPARPLDPTGAGDVFSVALAVALAEGQPLPDAVRFANAAGSLAVRVRGGVASAPTRAAVDALLREHTPTPDTSA